MNWVGGIRSRLKVKSDKKIQREFFEKKRASKKFERCTPLQSHGRNRNNSSQGVSLDLVAFNTIVKAYDKISGFKTERTQKNPTFVDIDKSNQRDDDFQFRELQMSPCPEESRLDLNTASQDEFTKKQQTNQAVNCLRPTVEDTPEITVVYRKQHNPAETYAKVTPDFQSCRSTAHQQYSSRQIPPLSDDTTIAPDVKEQRRDLLCDAYSAPTQSNHIMEDSYSSLQCKGDAHQMARKQRHSSSTDLAKIYNASIEKDTESCCLQNVFLKHASCNDVEIGSNIFDMAEEKQKSKISPVHELASDVHKQVQEILDIEQELNESQLEWEDDFSEDDSTISSAWEDDSVQCRNEGIKSQTSTQSKLYDNSTLKNSKTVTKINGQCLSATLSAQSKPIELEYDKYRNKEKSGSDIFTSTPSHNFISPGEWLQCMETPSALPAIELSPLKNNIAAMAEKIDKGIQTEYVILDSNMYQTNPNISEQGSMIQNVEKSTENDLRNIISQQEIIIEMFRLEEINKLKQITKKRNIFTNSNGFKN